MAIMSNGDSDKKVPLSVEALLAKQREEAAVKPKFLTKAEREKLALEQRQQEVATKKEKEEKERKEREEFERKAHEEARKNDPRYQSRYDDSRSSYYDDRDRHYRDGIPTGPRADRRSDGRSSSYRDDRYREDRYRGDRYRDDRRRDDRYRDDRYRDDRDRSGRERDRVWDKDRVSSSRDVSYRASPADGAGRPNGPSNGSSKPLANGNGAKEEIAPATEKEMQLIRERYLGGERQKKKKARKTAQSKFLFDWDQTEDTTDDVNPIFAESVPVQLYGKGQAGGVDPSLRPGAMTNEHRMSSVDHVEGRRPRKHGRDERHWSAKRLEEMTERDWRIFREDYAIAARGGSIPLPLRSWKESSIPASILDVIDQIGYKEPSPIQRQAIPIGLQNRDLIGIAETGSGKTASFVIPMLVYISELPPLTEESKRLGPYALILAPTRELAQQIEGETRKFASALGYRCVSIVGGRAIEEQATNMEKGAEIVIATPGRLKDCIQSHVLVLSQCTYVVMDEADRMINLGFEDVVNYILDSLPVSNVKPDTDDAEDPLRMLRKTGEEKVSKYRVTMLYSATMPPQVERLARKYLRRPATITIGDSGAAVGTVMQNVEFIKSEEKRKARLLEILASEQYAPPIIVFVNQKKAADMVSKDLVRAGWNATTLHSGKTQEQREQSLRELRSGEAPVLVATDLAGRGIDVPDVSLVINFQMSNHIEAYVHRIGRTGRAGKTGTAITFLADDDDEVMYDLKQEIGRSPISKVPVELAKHPSAQTRITREMKRKRDEEE